MKSIDDYWRNRASEMMLAMWKKPYGRARLMHLAIDLYGKKDDTNAFRVMTKLRKVGYAERVTIGVYQLTELGKEAAREIAWENRDHR